MLPAWLSLFTVDWGAGQFSYEAKRADGKPRKPALYGSVDTIHVLATTGLLGNLSSSMRDKWAAQIDSYQQPDGFYHHESTNSKYHAMGEATASLALLGRFPKYNNSDYEAFAESGPAEWKSLYDSLFWNNGSGILPGRDGCGSSIHGCGQIIGSYPSVLAYTTGSKHAAFIEWWVPTK